MKKRAQSIVEYTMLILATSAAIAIMVTYMKRAVNKRLSQVRQELNESHRGGI